MEGIDVEFTDVSSTVAVWDPLVTKTLRPRKTPTTNMYTSKTG